MAIACALLVSDDVGTIEEFKIPLRQLSISSEVCRDGPTAISLLKLRKFDAVIHATGFRASELLSEVAITVADVIMGCWSGS